MHAKETINPLFTIIGIAVSSRNRYLTEAPARRGRFYDHQAAAVNLASSTLVPVPLTTALSAL
jgi:hypothetical protein